MNYLLLFINILILVGGQTLWKIGVSKQSIDSSYTMFMAMLSPWVIAGICLYGIATVISVYLLSKMPLSLVYPLQSLAYVVAVAVGLLIFHEHVSMTRWLGVLVILIGSFLIIK